MDTLKVVTQEFRLLLVHVVLYLTMCTNNHIGAWHIALLYLTPNTSKSRKYIKHIVLLSLAYVDIALTTDKLYGVKCFIQHLPSQLHSRPLFH